MITYSTIFLRRCDPKIGSFKIREMFGEKMVPQKFETGLSLCDFNQSHQGGLLPTIKLEELIH